MVGFERKVGPKGQVVIPKEIRKVTGIRPNSEVVVTMEGGNVVIKKRTGNLAEWLREKVKQDGKALKKMDSDRDYDEMMEERFRK